MIDLILELVKENNRVIVPNFGAFIVSKDNGYAVLFNNFLSFNDGLLVNHLSSTQKITTEEALQKVNDFVEELKKALDEKGIYEIDKLGKFTKDENGILRFIQDEKVESLFHEMAPAKEPQPAKDLLDIDVAHTNESELKEEKSSTPPLPKSHKKEKLLQIETEQKKQDMVKPVEKTAAKPIKPQYKKAPEPSRNQEVKHGEKRKSPVIWFLLIFILLPLAGGLIYYFGFMKQSSEQPVTAKEIPVMVSDTLKDTIQTNLSDAMNPPKDETSLTGKKRYHIIAGTFNNEKAANYYVQLLHDKGFSEAFMIPRYSKFLVSIDAAEDLITAEARQEEIVNTYRIENYILTVR